MSGGEGSRRALRRSTHAAYPWSSEATAAQWSGFARGYAWRGTQHYSSADLAREVASRAALGEAADFVEGLNGAFCVVAVSQGAVFAAVDRVRSFPLFFGTPKGALVVADDPIAVVPDGSLPRLGEESMVDILRCGYALRERTLLDGVSQLQAGQYLEDRDGVPRALFYYQHLHEPQAGLGHEELVDRLTSAASGAFDRFIEQLGGRTCIVPLSGGYDSRFIVAMLKRAGYDNVACYTYGAQGSHEVSPARLTAERLGYPWHYVPYEAATWQGFWESPDVAEYLRVAGAYAALPHVQEYPAIAFLRERGLLPEDAVFSPGFCGDLLGGSYVPSIATVGEAQALLDTGIARYVYDSHMVLKTKLSAGLEKDLLARVQGSLNEYPTPMTLQDFVSVNEAWFTVHKVARFVVNSLRVYEHFGHEWLMPLWDNELVEAWYRVPDRLRVGSRLYDDLLFDWLFRPLGIAFEKPHHVGDRWPASTVRAVLPDAWYAAVRSRYGALKMRLRPPNPNAFLELAELTRHYGRGRSLRIPWSSDINQVISPVVLDRMCKELSSPNALADVYGGRARLT